MIMAVLYNLIGWIQLYSILSIVDMLNEKFPWYLRIKDFIQSNHVVLWLVIAAGLGL
jgi:hypothetical protein